MTPPSLRRSLLLLAAASCALLAGGCERSADEDTVATVEHTQATPSPSPSKAADRTGRKALSAYNSVSAYLKEQDPALREKLEKAAGKFVKDRDKWRERLSARQREIAPKITRLREQLGKVEGQSAEALRKLRQELSGLETQRADAEHKLSELESVTSDTWNSFREQLGLDDDTAAASPTPGKR